MSEKEFINADALVRDSFALARAIYDSGFRPDVLLVLWRGGTPVGVVVHEFLHYKGVPTYHAVIKAESYGGIDRRAEPRLEHADSVLAAIPRGAKVLVVDDIFDTGSTIAKLRSLLAARTDHVRVATLFYRPARNRTAIAPDYYLRETDRWIVFPHEIVDLTPDEIRRKDEYLYGLLFQESTPDRAPDSRHPALPGS